MSAAPVAELQARLGHEEDHGNGARRMFQRIAPTYDRLNGVLSGGLDRRWRRRALEELALTPRGPVLDLCAGTMDLTAELARRRPEERVVAVDFAEAMLEEGRHKAPRAEVVVADATSLPFSSASFAAVVCGFGMRNLADARRGAEEVRRVLVPGGVFVTLEFFRPVRPSARLFHATYAKLVLPAVGGWLSGDGSAYRYLAKSMMGFLSRAEYEELLGRVGFQALRGFDLTLGVASIVRAEVGR
jgi:ubiquinone/menaquinone biosynthesis methyltransferase